MIAVRGRCHGEQSFYVYRVVRQVDEERALLCYLKKIYPIHPGEPGWDPGQPRWPYHDDPLKQAKWLYALYANPEKLAEWEAFCKRMRDRYGPMVPYKERRILERYKADRLQERLERREARADRKAFLMEARGKRG